MKFNTETYFGRSQSNLHTHNMTTIQTIVSGLTEEPTMIRKSKSGWYASTVFMSASGLKSWNVSTSRNDNNKIISTSASEVDIKQENGYQSMSFSLCRARGKYWNNDKIVMANEKAIRNFHIASLEKFKALTDADIVGK